LKKIDFDILGVVPLEEFHRIPNSREKKDEQRSTKEILFLPVRQLKSSIHPSVCAQELHG